MHDEGAIYWGLVGVLAGSALLGSQIGFRLVRHISVRALKAFFTVVLMLVGIKVILGSGHPAPIGEAHIDFLDYTFVAILGVIAGILVPLLGIGGGLAMVPGLLLLVPEIGYLGTRATSMAVAAIIATRSLWMYARRGELDRRTGGFLALGALVGAYGGVSLVHLPGVAATAQILMGVILCVTSLRFFADVRKKA